MNRLGQSSTLRVPVLVLLGAMASGCDDDGDLMSCIPGLSETCTCGDGSVGAQECLHDGTFGACVCDGEGDAGGRDTDVIDDGGEERDDGDVVIDLCGDGERNGDEECDDGNTETEPCEYGERSCMVCDGACELSNGETSFCGDGRTDRDFEDCDGDDDIDCAYGFRSCAVCRGCQLVAGSSHFCGDAEIDWILGDERCDDGNDDPSDGCTSDCEFLGDEYEPNNSSLDAVILEPDSSGVVTHGPDVVSTFLGWMMEDEDIFEVYICPGGQMHALLEFANTEGNLDLLLGLTTGYLEVTFNVVSHSIHNDFEEVSFTNDESSEVARYLMVKHVEVSDDDFYNTYTLTVTITGCS